MLLAAIGVPPSDAALSAAARVSGLTLADVRTRLAGVLPRVLLVEPDADRARATALSLESLGFAMVVCDPRVVPHDEDRLVARTVEWGPRGFAVSDEGGARENIVPRSLILMQRGVRTTTTTEVTKRSERRLDLTRAVLTGGLLLTKKVDTQSVRTKTARDAFLLLQRSGGERDVIIYERRIDYRFLDRDIQPSSAANFELLVTRQRAHAAGVAYDDRVARPGFLAGLPTPPAAAVDVALWLVLLAHLRGHGRGRREEGIVR